ncbi:hypothetical protein L1887_14828 [Cichorium endivia]|nr:hypothetical protein L1887_14828 [Cichorium endivia]
MSPFLPLFTTPPASFFNEFDHYSSLSFHKSEGKILHEEMKFSSLGAYNGVYKIQLIVSQGLHQGVISNFLYRDHGPIKKESPVVSSLRRPTKTNRREKQVTVVKSQFERWKLTRVIALSNSDRKVVPQEVWNCGSSVRFLDLNCNSIQDIPEFISGLSSLQKLFLNSNCIEDESLSWKRLSSLKSLSFLSLSQNLYRSSENALYPFVTELITEITLTPVLVVGTTGSEGELIDGKEDEYA